MTLHLCYTLAKVDDETVIYALLTSYRWWRTKKLAMLAKVKCKAVLDTLAARETEVKVDTLGNTVSELKGIETLDTLSDTVAENEVESLGNKQVKVNAEASDRQV